MTPTLDAEPQRDKKGRFIEGHSVSHTIYQRYADRVKSLQELFTAEQIVEIAKDRKKLLKRSARDAQIIISLAKSFEWPDGLSNSDVRAERETLIDRVEGKSAQTLHVGTTEEADISKIADERLLRLERELSRITGADAVLIAPEPKRLEHVPDDVLNDSIIDTDVVDIEHSIVLNDHSTTE